MKGGKKIVCPSCPKKFASMGALTAHKRDSHGNGGNKNRQSTRSSQPKSSGGMKVVNSSGKDYLATFNAGASSSPGTRCWFRPLSPCYFDGTRLCQEASLWARWRPVRLLLHVNCAGASTTFGSVSVGWDPDPTNNWLGKGSEDQVRRVLALPSSRTFRLSESGTIPIPVETSRKWYQTTGEPDQRCHGSLIAVITGTTGGFQGSVSITGSLTWTVAWEGEQPPPITTTVNSDISPDSGWSDLFTTSDGSFDADRLTFKMHSGGDMAPWSAARLGIVYTTEGTRTKVPYYDEAGKAQECKYFAKIAGYSSPGLLLFSSIDKAKAYIRTGDISNSLKYVKAGDFASPSVPVLRSLASITQTVDYDRISDLEDKINLLMAAIPTLTVNREASSTRILHSVKAVTNLIDKGRLNVSTQQPKGTFFDPMIVVAAGQSSAYDSDASAFDHVDPE